MYGQGGVSSPTIVWRGVLGSKLKISRLLLNPEGLTKEVNFNMGYIIPRHKITQI